MKKNISKPLRRVLSVALSLVFACQMALPAFAQAATTPQTGTTTPPTTEQQPAQGTTNNPTGTTGTDGTTGTTDASGTTGTTGTAGTTGTTGTADNTVTALPTITSDSYIVMNAETGQILISKNPDKRQYPGDITKMLTSALALEYVDPEGSYTITTEDVFPTYPESYRFSNGTYVAITQDEVVKIRDLLYGSLIQSADDTANSLADCAAKLANRSVAMEDGSTSYTAGFMEILNEKVKSLGCVNSNFVNPHGLYNENQYTTAYDMALITRYALGTPNFLQYFGQTEYSMEPTNKQSLPRNWRRNSDESMMLSSSENYYNGILGMKVGHTTQGNYTGVSVVERDGVRLICVALNCTGSSAYALQTDMTNLFNYCYGNFTPITYTAAELAPEGFRTPVYSTRSEGTEGSEYIGNATYSTDSDFTVLLHKNFSKDDIVLTSDIPGRYYQDEEMASTITFSISNSRTQEAAQYMVPTMAALKLKVNVLTFNEIKAQKQQARQELFTKIFNVVKIVFIIFLVLLILLLIVRFHNKRKYKKRIARKRAAEARRQQLQQNSAQQRSPSSSNPPRRKR